jgi:hypothetical protein
MLFDFWGVVLELFVPSPEDERHFFYYFQDYILPQGFAEPRWSVRLSTTCLPFTGGKGQRKIEIKNSDGPWELYEEFSRSTKRPMPIPPFTLPPLNQLTRNYHASAASHPHDPLSALVIRGPSKTGKSILLLELLRAGWYYISDDTLVTADGGASLLRYTRPVGIREKAVELLPWINSSMLKRKIAFNTDTGKTTVVHPGEFYFRRAPLTTRAVWEVLLEFSEEFSVVPGAPGALTLRLDIDRHLGDALKAINEFSSL